VRWQFYCRANRAQTLKFVKKNSQSRNIVKKMKIRLFMALPMTVLRVFKKKPKI